MHIQENYNKEFEEKMSELQAKVIAFFLIGNLAKQLPSSSYIIFFFKIATAHVKVKNTSIYYEKS